MWSHFPRLDPSSTESLPPNLSAANAASSSSAILAQWLPHQAWLAERQTLRAQAHESAQMISELRARGERHEAELELLRARVQTRPADAAWFAREIQGLAHPPPVPPAAQGDSAVFQTRLRFDAGAGSGLSLAPLHAVPEDDEHDKNQAIASLTKQVAAAARALDEARAEAAGLRERLARSEAQLSALTLASSAPASGAQPQSAPFDAAFPFAASLARSSASSSSASFSSSNSTTLSGASAAADSHAAGTQQLRADLIALHASARAADHQQLVQARVVRCGPILGTHHSEISES